MKKIILIFALLTVFLSACKKEFTEKEFPNVNKTMVDLTIDDNFNWKTTKDVEVKLIGLNGSVVHINSTEGANYHKGLLTSGIEYTTKITIPTFVNEVHLVSSGKTEVIPIVNNKVEFNL
ncbi:MAG: hypothetical protein H8E34_05060 [Bacteroidetes bacterium]|nr:hypothetical protein [Bacteroidota bacterium]